MIATPERYRAAQLGLGVGSLRRLKGQCKGLKANGIVKVVSIPEDEFAECINAYDDDEQIPKRVAINKLLVVDKEEEEEAEELSTKKRKKSR